MTALSARLVHRVCLGVLAALVDHRLRLDMCWNSSQGHLELVLRGREWVDDRFAGCLRLRRVYGDLLVYLSTATSGDRALVSDLASALSANGSAVPGYDPGK